MQRSGDKKKHGIIQELKADQNDQSLIVSDEGDERKLQKDSLGPNTQSLLGHV